MVFYYSNKKIRDHSFTYWWTGLFLVLTIVNQASMNIHIQAFGHTFISLLNAQEYYCWVMWNTHVALRNHQLFSRVPMLGHVKHACFTETTRYFTECPCTSLSLWPHVSSNSVWGDCIFYESLLCFPWSSLASPVPVCCQRLEILPLRFMSEGRSKVKVLSAQSQALF